MFRMGKDILSLAKVIRNHRGPVLNSEMIRVKRSTGSAQKKDHNQETDET
jgi:hypothetical protein